MAKFTRTLMVAIALTGCYDDSGNGVREDETGTGMMPTSTSTSSSGDETPGTSITQGSSPSTTEPGTEESGSSGEPVDPMGFDFDDAPPEDFAQMDRIGMPAIGTAVITSKDEYNASTPFADLEGMWSDEIVGNLTSLHAALDDDLVGAGLVPCEVGLCVAQAGPLVIPDTLKLTIDDAPGFPNGRMPEDTVIDVLLAIILLDLSQSDQTTNTLVGTNPTANDKAFLDDFPYFAERHE